MCSFRLPARDKVDDNFQTPPVVSFRLARPPPRPEDHGRKLIRLHAASGGLFTPLPGLPGALPAIGTVLGGFSSVGQGKVHTAQLAGIAAHFAEGLKKAGNVLSEALSRTASGGPAGMVLPEHEELFCISRVVATHRCCESCGET